MGKQLEKTGADVAELLARVISSWHPDLEAASVRIETVFVYPTRNPSGNVVTPALVQRGFVVLADIRPADDLERLLCGADVILRLAADCWDELTDRNRLALLDHQLTHLRVQRDRDDQPKRHGDGRPKIKTVEHDWILAGFSAVVERHGEHAIEMTTAREVRQQCQMLFAFDTPRPRRMPREQTTSAAAAG